MRITICGSMRFAGRIVEIFQRLKEMGHEPIVHEDLFSVADGTIEYVRDKSNHTEHSEIKKKYDYIKAWHDLVLKGDAILVCNFDKGRIKNYIGGNTLLEIGFAHVNDKKIFLLNQIPEIGYKDEIVAMQPIILNGDLNRIGDSK